MLLPPPSEVPLRRRGVFAELSDTSMLAILASSVASWAMLIGFDYAIRQLQKYVIMQILVYV